MSCAIVISHSVLYISSLALFELLCPWSVIALLALQVFTIKQWAILIVQSYPYLPILETHFEAMASEAGAPSKAQIVAAAQTNPMAAEWRHVNKYLENIASMNCNEYIPLLDRPTANNALSAPHSSAAVTHTSQEELAAAAAQLRQARAGPVSRTDSSGLYQEAPRATFGPSHQGHGAAVGVMGMDSQGMLAFNQSVNDFIQDVPGYSPQVSDFNQQVPFKLDPAVSALPSLPVAPYQDAAAYMQSTDPAAFYEQSVGTSMQRGHVMPSLTQRVSANAMQSNAATSLGQAGGLKTPFMMPQLM